MKLTVMAVVVVLCKFCGGEALTEDEIKKEAIEQADQVGEYLKHSIKEMFQCNSTTFFGLKDRKIPWLIGCNMGSIYELQAYNVTAIHWNENTSMNPLEFTIDIEFPSLRFEFKDSIQAAGDCNVLKGDNSLTFKDSKFRISVKKQLSDGINDLWFYDIRSNYTNNPELLGNLTNTTVEDKTSITEYLLSKFNDYIKSSGAELFLEYANNLVRRGHLWTYKIEAYNKLNAIALKGTDELEGILIELLTDLFSNESAPLRQLTLQKEPQSFANWEDKDWQMSVKDGEILKLNSVQYDNMYCNWDSLNETLLCDFEIHFTNLEFKFTNLTHNINMYDLKFHLGSQSITYSDVYFSILVTANEKKGFELIDMNCRYNNYRRTEHSSISLLALEKLYLHAFLMSNVKYYIENNKNVYLTKGNELIKQQPLASQSFTIHYKYNLPKTRYDELQSVLQKTELWIDKGWFGKNAKMELTDNENSIMNWPGPTWNVEIQGGNITSIRSVQNYELCNCRYNWLTTEIRCTQKFYFPELSFEFSHLQYTTDDGRYVDGISKRQVIHYEDVYFTLVTKLKRNINTTEFAFETMYIRYNHAKEVVPIIINTVFPKAAHFSILQFLMANVKYKIEEGANREALLKKLNDLLKKITLRSKPPTAEAMQRPKLI